MKTNVSSIHKQNKEIEKEPSLERGSVFCLNFSTLGFASSVLRNFVTKNFLPEDDKNETKLYILYSFYFKGELQSLTFRSTWCILTQAYPLYTTQSRLTKFPLIKWFAVSLQSDRNHHFLVPLQFSLIGLQMAFRKMGNFPPLKDTAFFFFC